MQMTMRQFIRYVGKYTAIFAAFMAAMEVAYYLQGALPPVSGWPRMVAMEILISVGGGFFAAGVIWLVGRAKIPN
jgi:hypothetical protein